MKIGIQLYSLSSQIEEQGLDAIFQMLSSNGYDCVEFAGFYNYSVEEIVQLLNKYNLKSYSAHTDTKDMEKQMPYFLAIGIKTVYIPWRSADELSEKNFDTVIKDIIQAKKILDEHGIALGYHNHSQEYLDGQDRVRDILNAVDGVYSEMDIFWVKSSGLSPIAKLKEYGKRVNCLHIKEMDKRAKLDNPYEFPNPIIGEGQCEIEEIFKVAKQLDINLCILEIEHFCCDTQEYLYKSMLAMKNFSK